MVAKYYGNKQLRRVTLQLKLESVQDKKAKPLSRVYGYQPKMHVTSDATALHLHCPGVSLALFGMKLKVDY